MNYSPEFEHVLKEISNFLGPEDARRYAFNEVYMFQKRKLNVLEFRLLRGRDVKTLKPRLFWYKENETIS